MGVRTCPGELILRSIGVGVGVCVRVRVRVRVGVCVRVSVSICICISVIRKTHSFSMLSERDMLTLSGRSSTTSIKIGN